MPASPANAADEGTRDGAASDVASTSSQTPFARQMRPWFLILLLLQFFFLVLRWRMGDAHGALLMFAVWAVGVLSLSVGSSGVDAIYGGYFGLMAFVSGLLDLNLAIEHIVWTEWKQLKHDTLHKGDFTG